jgi:hypothetical protein
LLWKDTKKENAVTMPKNLWRVIGVSGVASANGARRREVARFMPWINEMGNRGFLELRRMLCPKKSQTDQWTGQVQVVRHVERRPLSF